MFSLELNKTTHSLQEDIHKFMTKFFADVSMAAFVTNVTSVSVINVAALN